MRANAIGEAASGCDAIRVKMGIFGVVGNALFAPTRG